MLVILSQKVDSESSYSDELFNSYHYPAKYRNLLHKGDVFIYYQGNRQDKRQRYYFAVGTVGEILTTDGENYYAKLLDCQQFGKKVPIYLPDGGYIEQLGYDSVRKSVNPPWQSSIRPLSQEAFDYILNAAGVQTAPATTAADYSVDELKEQLKQSVRDFFVKKDKSAIHRIESISAAIGRAVSVDDTNASVETFYQPVTSAQDRLADLLEYCRTMKMSYSYKPVLILALLHAGDKNGALTVNKAAQYFRAFYNDRRAKGLPAEKKKCIYQRADITDQQIEGNIISNPVKVLVESGFFFYNEKNDVFSISPEIWAVIDSKHKASLTRICNQKLKDYFKD